jgi:hypothetical protein
MINYKKKSTATIKKMNEVKNKNHATVPLEYLSCIQRKSNGRIVWEVAMA